MILQHARAKAWTQYWASGALHSCAGSYEGNYAGAIADFWRGEFAYLGGSGRMLDIATGNGPIPKLMLQSGTPAAVTCDAVDLAVIAPPWLASLDAGERVRIRFHPGIAAEQLPFPDQSFDLVTSQYGIEYTNLPRTIAEVRRVLRPEGRVSLVLHSSKSVPLLKAATELEHLAFLLGPDGLLDAALPMIEPMTKASTEAGRILLSRDRSAGEARERFNNVQRTLQARLSQIDVEVLLDTRHAVSQVLALATNQSAKAAHTALAALRAELVASQWRLEELCKYALDEEAALAVAGLIHGASGSGAVHALEDQGRLMGWCMQITPGT